MQSRVQNKINMRYFYGFSLDEYMHTIFSFKVVRKILGINIFFIIAFQLHVQQGLEIRCFWFQKNTVQLKTALREVYTYVLNGIFSQKTVYLQGFWPKSAYLKVTVM